MGSGILKLARVFLGTRFSTFGSFGLALFAFGCREKNHSDSSIAGTGRSEILSLLVMDGTRMTYQQPGTLKHLVQSLDVPDSQKQYLEGPNLLASNSETLVLRAVQWLCQQRTQFPTGVLLMVGYSRGGIHVLEAAKRAQEQCQAKVKWVGLVDAVSTSLQDFAREVPKGTQCTHIMKRFSSSSTTSEQDPPNQGIIWDSRGPANTTAGQMVKDQLLKTQPIEGCNRDTKEFPISHTDFANHAPTLGVLQQRISQVAPQARFHSQEPVSEDICSAFSPKAGDGGDARGCMAQSDKCTWEVRAQSVACVAKKGSQPTE